MPEPLPCMKVVFLCIHLRADIDYGFVEAKTVMGRIGIKVWIYKGEILPVKEEAELAEATAEPGLLPPWI